MISSQTDTSSAMNTRLLEASMQEKLDQRGVTLFMIKKEILEKMRIWKDPVSFSKIIDLIDNDKYAGGSITYQAIVELIKDGLVVEEERKGNRVFIALPETFLGEPGASPEYPRVIFEDEETSNFPFRIVQMSEDSFFPEESTDVDLMGDRQWDEVEEPSFEHIRALAKEIVKLRGW